MKTKRPLKKPDGLEQATDLALAVYQAQNELQLAATRLVQRPDVDTEQLEAWARSLTETNCSWMDYDVAQAILLALSAQRQDAPPAAGQEAGG
jgi:hypothetical protein